MITLQELAIVPAQNSTAVSIAKSGPGAKGSFWPFADDHYRLLPTRSGRSLDFELNPDFLHELRVFNRKGTRPDLGECLYHAPARI